MNRFVSVFTAVLLLAMAIPMPANAANMGDPAAPLAVTDWIQGNKVELGKENKVCVIEFWATWCAPCRESAPHLTALQSKYKDDLVIVGISDEDPALVKSFVEKMGDQMTYTIAVDGLRITYDQYFSAYELQGVPTAIIVDREGRVTWVGHPLDPTFEEVLDKVIAGSYDGAAARKDEELQKLREALFQEFSEYCKAGEVEKAKTLADRIMVEHSTSPELLTAISWVYLNTTNETIRNPERAVQFGAAAVKATEGKNPRVLEIYAQALSESGDLDGAIEEQRRAIELAPERARPELQEQLDKYLAAKAAQAEPAA